MITESMKIRMQEDAKRIENDVHHSAKGHYQEARYWSKLHLFLGIPTAITSAIAGVSALAQFDNHAILAGVLATIVAALTGITTFLHPDRKATTHQGAGSKYSALRNKTRTFYNLDIYTEKSEQELLEQLRSLATQRDELNEGSLPISNRAYKSARKSILEKQTRQQKIFQDNASLAEKSTDISSDEDGQRDLPAYPIKQNKKPLIEC